MRSSKDVKKNCGAKRIRLGLQTRQRANMGQVNKIKSIKKGGKITMTGSGEQNMTHQERNFKIKKGNNLTKPKTMTLGPQMGLLV